MASPPQVRVTWPVAAGSAAATVEERALSGEQGVAGHVQIHTVPWRLVRSSPLADSSEEITDKRCEICMDWSAQPLRCKQLTVSIVSSARHVELYVEGVRRTLLGEEEASEVYFGTFRGTATDAPPLGADTVTDAAATAPAANTKYFSISEQFNQQTMDHNVIKCIHKLRVKFVSLTGDKSALELVKMSCLYVSTGPPASVWPGAMAPRQEAAGNSPYDLSSATDLMAMMAGMSLSGVGNGTDAGAQAGASPAPNPQMFMMAMQQMMMQQVDAKITQVLDAKLSKLSQRLAFTEQMLLQVQQRSDAKTSQLEKQLSHIQQQVGELRGQVPIVTPDNEANSDEQEKADKES